MDELIGKLVAQAGRELIEEKGEEEVEKMTAADASKWTASIVANFYGDLRRALVSLGFNHGEAVKIISK